MRTRCGLLLLLAIVAFNAAAGRPAGAEAIVTAQRTPLLSGTFIQLQESNAAWDRKRWESLFDTFQSIGLRQVVVQWSVNDNRAFYPSHSFNLPPAPALEHILRAADQRGIDVYVGLVNDPLYWERLQQSQLYLEDYLNRLRLKSERVAQEVAELAHAQRAFKGWYITEEIDDLTWRQPKTRLLLYRHIRQLSLFLKKLTPAGTVMLSGFSNARMAPDSYEEFWRGLFSEAPVDIVLFQDGIGAGKLSLEHLPLYLQAVRNAVTAHNRKLQVVVELFETVSEAPFKAKPAALLRIKRQLEVAADYATAGIGSFSIPDYMSPEGGDGAGELLRNYQEYGKLIPVTTGLHPQ